jgi:hypothetical protein
MPDIRCPHCDASMMAPEGPLGPCPACGKPLAGEPHDAIVAIPQDPVVAETPAAVAEPVLPSPAGTREIVLEEDWGPFRAGLDALFCGNLLNVGAVLLQIVLACLIVTTPAPRVRPGPLGDASGFLDDKDKASPPVRPAVKDPSVVSARITNALGCVGILGGLLVLVGLGLCCAVPSRSRGRLWGIAGGFCLLASAGLAITVVMSLYERRYTLAQYLSHAEGDIAPILLVAILAFLSSLCFAILLRAAAVYLGDRVLGNSFVVCCVASWLLPVALGLLFGLFLGELGAKPVGRDTSALMAFFSLVMGGLTLALTIWFLVLIRRLRKLTFSP